MRGLSFLMTLIGAWLGAAPAHAGRTLVATLPDLGAIARAVAGSDWKVVVLAEPDEDPHYVDPRPSFLVAIAKADVLLFNGLDLEIGWLPPLITNARNGKVQPNGIGHVDASTFVTAKLGVPQGKIDRAMGDIHAGGNPHFTLGPDAVGEIAKGLAGRLALFDGGNAAAYVKRAEAFAAEVAAAAEKERARFAALPSEARRVVVYHDSLPYFVRWLGLEQVATIENKPGIKPSPSHVADVLATMKAQGVKAILQERWHPDVASKNLASLSGAKLVVLAGGMDEGQSYAARLGALAAEVYDALAH